MGWLVDARELQSFSEEKFDGLRPFLKKWSHSLQRGWIPRGATNQERAEVFGEVHSIWKHMGEQILYGEIGPGHNKNNHLISCSMNELNFLKVAWCWNHFDTGITNHNK